MSDASARIQGAIAVLEKQQKRATRGSWWVTGEGDVGSTTNGNVAFDIRPADADLIVTLHRTIDAQLTILRSCAHGLVAFDDFCVASCEGANGLALADSILGGDS